MLRRVWTQRVDAEKSAGAGEQTPELRQFLISTHRFSLFLSRKRLAARVHCSHRKVEQMLKITYDSTTSEQRWTLCGQLTGPWVAEARSTWERVRGRANGATCVVDLSDVTSIDERGERLLRSMNEDGAQFVARGVDMKHILTHLQSKAKPSLRRSLAHLDCDCS